MVLPSQGTDQPYKLLDSPKNTDSTGYGRSTPEYGCNWWGIAVSPANSRVSKSFMGINKSSCFNYRKISPCCTRPLLSYCLCSPYASCSQHLQVWDPSGQCEIHPTYLNYTELLQGLTEFHKTPILTQHYSISPFCWLPSGSLLSGLQLAQYSPIDHIWKYTWGNGDIKK